ncbi:MAG TPA: Stk1 family PASTA domain-containing Ser/Thr kinase [Actinomycetota bacterium]|nr:Stk1 family PASTA domain-containing Ser/Thr kinase [Actinomycetota bacterium]
MRSSSAPSPPDGVSPASTVGSPSGVTMRRTRSDLPLERFPREESTIARSITQPAPSHGGGQAFVTLDGRYHMVERIAAGGMGEVFRAHDAVLAREVAIKVLHRSLAGDPAFVDRFRREARAAAGLAHPNIVNVYDWGAVDGVYYMVMEYVRGPSVRHLLNEQGRMEPAQAAEILRQTLLALGHAHHEGFVHRDMKPENLLVTQEGVVKVADFGLARAYADGRVTQAGAVTGTVQYLAPEQIRGEPADPRSDLYSLGIVAYELLTGQLPFTGETAMAVAYKHLSDRVPAPSSLLPDLPEELDGFVAAATDRDRELRPESADVMRMDLDAIAHQLPAARKLSSLVRELPSITVEGGETTEVGLRVTTGSIPRMERHRRRRRLLKRFVGAILVLGLVAGAAWGTWTYAIPHTAVIPKLVGETVESARNRLTTLGFQVVLARGRYDMEVPEGQVWAVRPAAGATRDQGTPVTIIPSKGPPPVAVPAMRGKPLKKAEQAIRDAGLRVGEVRRRYDDRVPLGHVISQQPAGGRIPKGSTVSFLVSDGPKPVPIPDVRGMGQDKAVKALGARGFEVVIEEDFSKQVARGDVVATDPGPGTELQPGSTIVLTVSIGPEYFDCPNFFGMSVEEAKALAEQHGLELTALPVPGSGGNNVVSQIPGADTRIRYGSTVTVYYA